IKGPLFIFVVPIVLVCMWMFNLYHPRRDRSIWPEQRAILKTAVVSIGAVIVLLWAVGNDVVVADNSRTRLLLGHPVDGGRLHLALLALVLPVALGFHRAGCRMALRQVRRRGRNLRHVAIIGVGRLGQIVHRTLTRNPWTGINVAYFISHHPRTQRT